MHVIKPQRSARVTVVLCVSECVCVSVTVLAATYLVYMFKVRRYNSLL